MTAGACLPQKRHAHACSTLLLLFEKGDLKGGRVLINTNTRYQHLNFRSRPPPELFSAPHSDLYQTPFPRSTHPTADGESQTQASSQPHASQNFYFLIPKMLRFFFFSFSTLLLSELADGE